MRAPRDAPGSPPEKRGLINESKRSPIQAADFFWNKDVIQPRSDRFRTQRQEQLVPMFDECLVLDFESPVLEDEQYKLDLTRANRGAFRIPEWRTQAGFDEIPEGDRIAVDAKTKVVA